MNSNRTVAEWKFRASVKQPVDFHSNRTVAEWKSPHRPNIHDVTRFKSDRCGMEMAPPKLQPFSSDSNRTVAEWKFGVAVSPSATSGIQIGPLRNGNFVIDLDTDLAIGFKSDRCGMEINLVIQQSLTDLIQIGPLRNGNLDFRN